MKLQCISDGPKDAGIPPHKLLMVQSEVKVTGSHCLSLCLLEMGINVCVCVFPAPPQLNPIMKGYPLLCACVRACVRVRVRARVCASYIRPL